MDRFPIRAATQEDLAGVIALDRATELLPHWNEFEYAAALSSQAVLSAGNSVALSSGNGVARCLFVVEDGALAGFAVGMTVTAGLEVMAELESVAVARSARRRGVGRALCSAVVAWARSRGAETIKLEVRSGSSGAIGLYESLGFVAAGRRRNYYREPEDDAVLMRLAI